MLCNILYLSVIHIKIIKVKHKNNVFNAIKKAPKHRVCYTGSLIILQCSINKNNT